MFSNSKYDADRLLLYKPNPGPIYLDSPWDDDPATEVKAPVELICVNFPLDAAIGRPSVLPMISIYFAD